MSKSDKTRILLPKGEALEFCKAACEEELGIELPGFDGVRLSQETKDLSVYWLKPRDIGNLVARGFGDVGMVGTDVVLEYVYPSNTSKNRLDARRAGNSSEPMCRFSILATEGFGEGLIREILRQDSRRATALEELPTSYPTMLTLLCSAQDLPFKPYDMEINGSVEAYPSLLLRAGVADIVQTGNSSTANGLVEMMKLTDIYPEMLTASEQ